MKSDLQSGHIENIKTCFLCWVMFWWLSELINHGYLIRPCAKDSKSSKPAPLALRSALVLSPQSCLPGPWLNFVLCSYCMLVALCRYGNLHKVFVWLVMFVGLFWFLEFISLFFVFLRWPLRPENIYQYMKAKTLYKRAVMVHECAVIFKCLCKYRLQSFESRWKPCDIFKASFYHLFFTIHCI